MNLETGCQFGGVFTPPRWFTHYRRRSGVVRLGDAHHGKLKLHGHEGTTGLLVRSEMVSPGSRHYWGPFPSFQSCESILTPKNL